MLFISVGNNTTWEGTLTLAEDQAVFEWTIKSVKVGNWSMFVEIDWNYTCSKLNPDDPRYTGHHYEKSHALDISVSENSAYINETPFL